PQAAEEPRRPPAHLDRRRAGQAQRHRALLRARLPLLPPPAPARLRLDRGRPARRADLRRGHRRRPRRPPRRPPRPHPLAETRAGAPVGGADELGNALVMVYCAQVTWGYSRRRGHEVLLLT